MRFRSERCRLPAETALQPADDAVAIAPQRRPEAGPRSRHERGHEPEEQAVDDEDEQAQGEDRERQREQDEDRAGDGVDQPEHERDDQRGVEALDLDAAEEVRQREQRQRVDDPHERVSASASALRAHGERAQPRRSRSASAPPAVQPCRFSSTRSVSACIQSSRSFRHGMWWNSPPPALRKMRLALDRDFFERLQAVADEARADHVHAPDLLLARARRARPRCRASATRRGRSATGT